VIAVMGGVFDPVHFGHIKPALELLSRPQISQVRLMPCRVHPDKGEAGAGARHRLQMLELVAGAGLVVDGRELERDGVSYTADTLGQLRDEAGGEQPIAFVAGQDTAAKMHTWKCAARLPALAHLIVLARPDCGDCPLPAAWRRAEDLAALAASPAGCAYRASNRPFAASSGAIRAMIGRREQPRYLLPGAVWNYIRRHRLYGWNEPRDA